MSHPARTPAADKRGKTVTFSVALPDDVANKIAAAWQQCREPGSGLFAYVALGKAGEPTLLRCIIMDPLARAPVGAALSQIRLTAETEDIGTI